MPKKKALSRPKRKLPVLKKADDTITITTRIKGKKKTQPAKKKQSSNSGKVGWMSRPSPAPRKRQPVRPPPSTESLGVMARRRPDAIHGQEQNKQLQCVKKKNSACMKEYTACRINSSAAIALCGMAAMGTTALASGGNPLYVVIGTAVVTAGCAASYLSTCELTKTGLRNPC